MRLDSDSTLESDYPDCSLYMFYYLFLLGVKVRSPTPRWLWVCYVRYMFEPALWGLEVAPGPSRKGPLRCHAGTFMCPRTTTGSKRPYALHPHGVGHPPTHPPTVTIVAAIVATFYNLYTFVSHVLHLFTTCLQLITTVLQVVLQLVCNLFTTCL